VHDDYTLLTPENVELRYEIAGIGSRVLAASIDYTIVVLADVVLSFASAFGGSFLARVVRQLFPDARGAPDLVTSVVGALLILAIFLGWWGYFILFELVWNGQSPGKRMLGLRVVRTGGQPINVISSLVRNLLRLVDLFLLIGVLVMLVNRSSRRLGDLAAGTLVVRDPRALRAAFARVEVPTVDEDRIVALPNADRLTPEHYALIREFFSRRQRLAWDRADALEGVALRLATDLARLLEVPPSQIGDPVIFLATAARAYERRHPYYEAPALGPADGPRRDAAGRG
jgi:uncharacterized RDD family membrane protein YckC